MTIGMRKTAREDNHFLVVGLIAELQHMIQFRCRLPFAFALVLATAAPFLVAGELQDGADLPTPLTAPKPREADSLDEIAEAPVKPLPYHGLADDPITPTPQSTVSQFVTDVDDVEPYDILERPGVPVGWYAAVEVTAANPRVSNRQQSDNLLSGSFASPVSVPSSPLGWTAMPMLTVGYRRAEGVGDLSVSYRYLYSQGNSSIPSIGGGSGTGSSRLQMNVVDLDYSLADLFPNDLWLVPRQIRLTGGVRVAGIDNKSSASGGTILGQSASNTFVGAGPRVAIESMYPISSSHWAVFSRLDAAGVIGVDRQTFSQSTGGVSASATSSPSTIGVPVVGVRTGVNWLPEWGSGNVKMSAGYQWERWFDLGTSTSSFNELTIQGPFLRGEVAF